MIGHKWRWYIVHEEIRCARCKLGLDETITSYSARTGKWLESV